MLMKIKVVTEILLIDVSRRLVGSGSASPQNPSPVRGRFLAAESERKRPHFIQVRL
jgi:hypothetical protein